MKYNNLIFMKVIVLILIVAFATGCSEEEGANIEAFAGIYVGKYRAIIYDTENDTIEVTVDAANNKVFFKSNIINQTFETTFNPGNGRAEIQSLSVDTLKFVQGQAVNYAYNTTIGSGYCEMKNNETELYIQLNNCVVEDHTIDLLQNIKPLTVDVVNTPNNMKPI